MSGADDCAEGDGVVFGIEQAVELGAAGLHFLRQRGFAQALFLHQRAQLAGDHALEGAGGGLGEDAFLFEEAVKG